MQIEEFVLKRTQSLHENTVELNLSESGVQFSQLHAVDLVDIDGDGLKDIVSGDGRPDVVVANKKGVFVHLQQAGSER